MFVVGIHLGWIVELFALYVHHDAVTSRGVQVALAAKAKLVAEGAFRNPRMVTKVALESLYAALYALFMGADYLALIVALNRSVNVRALIGSCLALFLGVLHDALAVVIIRLFCQFWQCQCGHQHLIHQPSRQGGLCGYV